VFGWRITGSYGSICGGVAGTSTVGSGRGRPSVPVLTGLLSIVYQAVWDDVVFANPELMVESVVEAFRGVIEFVWV